MRINKLLGFFGGFLLSSVLDTTLGELNEWAIVGAALIVASLEIGSSIFYTILYRLKNFNNEATVFYLVKIINYIKIGIIYGLIVDAFKLGS